MKCLMTLSWAQLDGTLTTRKFPGVPISVRLINRIVWRRDFRDGFLDYIYFWGERGQTMATL